MALYGNDIDDTVTAFEADLGWIVKMGKGDFLGRDALAAQKAAGVPRRLVGFEMVDRGIARHGYSGEDRGGAGRRHVRARTRRRSASRSASRSCRRPRRPSEPNSKSTSAAAAPAARVVPTPFYKRKGS